METKLDHGDYPDYSTAYNSKVSGNQGFFVL